LNVVGKVRSKKQSRPKSLSQKQ